MKVNALVWIPLFHFLVFLFKTKRRRKEISLLPHFFLPFVRNLTRQVLLKNQRQQFYTTIHIEDKLSHTHTENLVRFNMNILNSKVRKHGFFFFFFKKQKWRATIEKWIFFCHSTMFLFFFFGFIAFLHFFFFLKRKSKALRNRWTIVKQ